VSAVRWSLLWEGELDGAERDELREMLAGCFPRARDLFAGARPEARVVGRVGTRTVAHLGILRRFLRLPGTGRSQLVGDVGLVGVAAQWRGRGLGQELLAAAARELHGLDLPYGYLSCGHHVVAFYERAGWVRVDNPTRQLGRGGVIETYPEASMLLPVRAGLADWPSGLLDRNGYEV
jgi:nodulation protein A